MASNSKIKMICNSKLVGSTERMLRFVTISVVFLGLAANCHAKNNCPWINETTAGGILGGDAVGDFTPPSTGQPAACTFTLTGANFTRTLRITVEVTPDTHARLQTAAEACGKNGAPLPAIGNEATVCALENRNAPPGEFVVSRVRDQLFTITFATTLKDDPILNRAALKDKAYIASEQVAGNLY
jgi:hypothetical protein